MARSEPPVVIVGAGVGGLAAAISLAARGVAVLVLERTSAPGGKMREVRIGAARLDAGPTVFTMRWVFDELLAAAGARLDEHLRLRPARLLARHAWDGGAQLDLYADLERSAAAIGAFAGSAEARRFLQFAACARRIYATLERPFIRAPRCPHPLALLWRTGWRGLRDLWAIRPFETLWRALGQHFHDPRLRQLFGRYATYCGSSPFQAPATLMLVAHVELDGVWLIDDGMHGLARALQQVAMARGALFRYGAHVARLLVEGGAVRAVELQGGERIAARAVIVNADPSAVGAGLFGEEVRPAAEPVAPPLRSLSAVTFHAVARARGLPLARHTVCFSRDYRAEFEHLRSGRLPDDPTVYVCAQDRDDAGGRAAEGPERLMCLVNAPALGDIAPLSPADIGACADRCLATLARCGLQIDGDAAGWTATTPSDFDRLFPGTGGALYGRASHGWRASFSRPGARTRIPGLYLVGGATHPGPGIPMAALSGRLAAAAVQQDLGMRAGA